MSLPYETATSGQNAIIEIQKVLQRFGCAKVGHMMDHANGELLVQFEYRGRNVSVKASINGYAQAWLKEHQYKVIRDQSRRQEREAEAQRVASVAVYSIIRDWLKGQITAVETGILTFDGAFLGQLLLPTGKTILETVNDQKLLPAPSDEKVVSIGAKP